MDDQRQTMIEQMAARANARRLAHGYAADDLAALMKMNRASMEEEFVANCDLVREEVNKIVLRLRAEA